MQLNFVGFTGFNLFEHSCQVTYNNLGLFFSGNPTSTHEKLWLFCPLLLVSSGSFGVSGVTYSLSCQKVGFVSHNWHYHFSPFVDLKEWGNHRFLDPFILIFTFADECHWSFVVNSGDKNNIDQTTDLFVLRNEDHCFMYNLARSGKRIFLLFR